MVFPIYFMAKIFTGNDLFLGRYETELKNWIFVFMDENKQKYEIIIPKDQIETFMRNYNLKNNIFYPII